MLDLNRYITEVRAAGRNMPVMNRLALALQKLQDGVNQVGTATGTDPNSHVAQPDAPTGINVSAGSDHVHVTLEDTAQRARAMNYFVEWATDPSFPQGQTHTEHLGATRERVLPLPAKDGSNATINYYFRGYKHTLGAEQASDSIVHGGKYTPTAVTLSGSSKLDLLPATGAGTAPTNGGQPGQGFGTPQFSTLPPDVPKAP